MASTIRGCKLVVPTDLDLGFVGYPCIDLSSLNVLPGQFMDTTTATGKGGFFFFWGGKIVGWFCFAMGWDFFVG